MCTNDSSGGMRPFVESAVGKMRRSAEQQKRYMDWEREGGPRPEFLAEEMNKARAEVASRKKKKTNARQGPAPAIARSGGGGADPRSLVSLSGGGIPAVRSFFTPV